MQLVYKKVEGPMALKLESLFGLKEGGLIEVNPGKVLVPPKFKDVAQRILDLEVRPDDVWLVSYPRTGKNISQPKSQLQKILINEQKYISNFRGQILII